MLELLLADTLGFVVVGLFSFLFACISGQTGFLCVALTGLELKEIYLPLPPKHWDLRLAPPLPGLSLFFFNGCVLLHNSSEHSLFTL